MHNDHYTDTRTFMLDNYVVRPKGRLVKKDCRSLLFKLWWGHLTIFYLGLDFLGLDIVYKLGLLLQWRFVLWKI